VNSGKQRLVVNLKPLNPYCDKPVFTMEGVKELAGMIKPKSWLWNVNLKDAYYAHPTAGATYCSSFSAEGGLVDRNIEWLSFWWCCSPRIYTKVVRAFVTAARRHGIATLAYLDDLVLSVHGSKGQGRSSVRAEDAQGTPTQSHTSPSIV